MTERYKTNSVTITMPWPAPELNPNARVHYRVKAPITKAARLEAKLMTLSQQPRRLRPPLYRHVEIYPPDGRVRDADNLIGSLKATFDGIMDALKVDDRMSSVSSGSWRVNECTPGGKIVITIGEDH